MSDKLIDMIDFCTIQSAAISEAESQWHIWYKNSRQQSGLRGPERSAKRWSQYVYARDVGSLVRWQCAGHAVRQGGTSSLECFSLQCVRTRVHRANAAADGVFPSVHSNMHLLFSFCFDVRSIYCVNSSFFPPQFSYTVSNVNNIFLFFRVLLRSIGSVWSMRARAMQWLLTRTLFVFFIWFIVAVVIFWS